MQYLSKAYSYYSGINPATLSGAIDVIVIRKVDSEGEVTLSSSPFHVRFGKLQVLRAGEKRVTLRLPNNLPPPHVAPFSMKVGETGEAFFVLETTDDVPEDLMTSPVVMPTENELLATPTDTHDAVSGPTDPHSLTQQPFGETERLAGPDDLGDVPNLDLNETSGIDMADDTPGHPPSSSVFDSAASLLPSNPFISSRATEETGDLADTLVAHHRRSKSQLNAFNGLATTSSENKAAGVHDLSDKSSLPSRTGFDQAALGSTANETGTQSVHRDDMVLDISGYHSEGRTADSNGRSTTEIRTSVLDAFARDLLAAIPNDKRPAMTLRATDPNIRNHGFEAEKAEDDPEDDDDEEMESRRFDRAKSEPPVDPPNPISPTLDPTKTAMAMDYAWDWGRVPLEGHRAPLASERRDSLPPPEIEPTHAPSARLRNVEENPFLFVLDSDGRSHTFELSLSETSGGNEDTLAESTFLEHRITFQKFIESPQIVDDPRLVVRYSLQYSTWTNNYRLLHALSMYRRSLTPPTQGTELLPSLDELGVDAPRNTGYAWSRWWRRGQATTPNSAPSAPPLPLAPPQPAAAPANSRYAKTLRLSSDQLKQLDLKAGPNTVQFSVTSSYTGFSVCSARIFLWEETDQIVISDIDGTITKSDALGHVYAAIGRDWTHLGIAKLYTDIANNGYRMLYLTSRAIGQADSTRGYLKSIVQGNYRLPEGPVIMSPDRLMASLHREVIMRKPELFKMACLRDILRLFPSGTQEAFYAGFGNRITDAMSYRSVGIPASKIYTIDSTGVVKTELLQAAGHKGSYIQLNDLVNEVFPPVSTKFKPEYTDFNFWRSTLPDVALPDLSPPSPALSVRSDTSSRLSVLGKFTGLGRRTSRQPLLPTSEPSSRPSSPLVGPSFTSEGDPDSRHSSLPGSYEEDAGAHFPAHFNSEPDEEKGEGRMDYREEEEEENYDYDNEVDNFDDDLLATGEMRNVPF